MKKILLAAATIVGMVLGAGAVIYIQNSSPKVNADNPVTVELRDIHGSYKEFKDVAKLDDNRGTTGNNGRVELTLTNGDKVILHADGDVYITIKGK